jgi:hypothetical protein
MRPTKGETSRTPASPQATAWQNDLDQHALARHAGRLVQMHQSQGAHDGGTGVERQTRVDLGGHASRYDLEDRAAEAHQQVVDHLVHRLPVARRHGLRQQRRVSTLLHRLDDERRIGRRVARREARQLVEVAGIGDDGRVLLELVELVHDWIRPQGFSAVLTLRRRAPSQHRRRAPAPLTH